MDELFFLVPREFIVAEKCGCCFMFSWLLINLVAALYFLLKLNANLEVTVNWLQSSQACERRYMFRMIALMI